MCIAIYVPKDQKMPDEETLKNCWQSNSDGGGFAILNEDHAVIKKGYMKRKTFLKALKDVKPPCIIHFRIKTAGKTDETNCHPFPVSKDEKDLISLHIKTKTVVAHNGILGKGEKNLSDTMVFIRDYLAPLKPYFFDKNIRSMIEEMLGYSKLIIWDNGTVYLFGTWLKDDGIYYSNDSYKTKPFVYQKSAMIPHYNHAQYARQNYWENNYEDWYDSDLEKYEKRKTNDALDGDDTWVDQPSCPYCGNWDITYFNEEDSYLCADCGTEFKIIEKGD